MKTGLVLSGGGARAFMHLGVLQALEEAGIVLDELAATSAGALVAALYASGRSPLQGLEILSKSALFRSVRFAFGGKGLLRMKKIETFFSQHFPENDFSALRIPLTITATDLIAGETVCFDHGALLQPLLASCGIPGLFEPYAYGGRELVDGGVLNNLPVECLEGKVDRIIGSHCNPFLLSSPLRNSWEVAYRSLLLAVHHQNIHRLRKCTVRIEPIEMARFGLFDFSKAKTMFDVGYRATQQAIVTDAGQLIDRVESVD
jgi:NTE family protein